MLKFLKPNRLSSRTLAEQKALEPTSKMGKTQVGRYAPGAKCGAGQANLGVGQNVVPSESLWETERLDGACG